MKTNQFNLISYRQYIFLIFGAQVGVGVLNLPRVLAEKAGVDGWISIIFGGIVAITANLIILQIMKKRPNETLLEILNGYFGKWGGQIGGFLIFLYFLFLSFVIIQRSLLFIRIWLIPGINEFTLMCLIALPIYIISCKGFLVISRYAELCFFLTVGILFFYILALKESCHWYHLLPIFKDINQTLSAIPSTIMSFLGFEITFFLHPFLQKKQLAFRGIIIANSLSTLFLLFITLSCFLFFSPDEIKQYHEPTISMLKIVETRFVERVEIIFLSLFLFGMSTTWMPYIYSAAFCMWRLRNKQNINTYVYLILISFIMLIYFIPPTFYQNDGLQRISMKVGLIVVYIFPLCLWIYITIYDRIRGRRIQ
ncbi:GerAB/ArcD/ProY family transporter [Bacillus cereus]|uniref:GerAB/ArcD/ProY family transporter n=1 Tax=Bacillus cereus TaxID=1396 RepID=UPI000BF9696E|nr:endospore germination permease [Bacillus cereus]PEQ66070.1 spore gernimation protein [Bacillus cereus]